MEGGWNNCSFRWKIMLQLTLIMILLKLPKYAKSQTCHVDNCSSQCYGPTCYGCKDGYYLQYQSSCKPCQQSLPGCTTCSSSTSCTKCNDGYYLQSGSCIQCQQSLSGCTKCSSSTSCTKCYDGYYLQSESCKPCQQSLSGCATCSSQTSCTKCTAGYYLQSGSCVTCQQYLPGCATCSSSTSCTKCTDGYYLQSGSCVTCQQYLPGCATCSSSTSCTKCTDGYYLQNGSCVLCPERCSTCTSSTQCTTCKDAFWNKNNNECSSYCSVYCLNGRCDVSTGFCNSCIQGKYGPQCEQDCNLCKDGKCDLRKCTNGCKDEYYQENTDLGYSYCYKCAYNNCIICSNGTYCTHCEQGYYRNYYRLEYNGRGTMNCLQCYKSCLDCSYTEYCHEDCIQYCNEPISPRTTRLIMKTSKTTPTSNAATKPPSTSNDQQTSSQSTNHSSDNKLETNRPVTKDTTTTISTKPLDVPQTDSSVQKADDNSSTIIGAATGGGTVVVLAIVVILVVCLIKRRSKDANQNRIENPIEALVNGESDYPVYAKSNKPSTSNNQPTQDYLYAVPNKLKQSSRKHTKSEIDEPQRVSYRNIMIDLEVEQGITAESNVDDVQLEIVDGDGVTADIDMGESIPTSDTYYNMEGLIRSQVKVTQLFDYVKQKNDYEKEFTKLLKGLQRSCNEALKPHNRQKNRYNGIYAYDATRVVLRCGTYINANYIDGHNKEKAYIASLGPTASTMNDYETFWEMIWQHNVDSIVMLTKLEEGVKMKCEQYWPNQGEVMTCGQYILEGVSEKTFADFDVRNISLQKVDTFDKLHVIQYQYTAWPDRSVPDSVVSLVAFRDKVQQQNRMTTSPIVVHCSAGIGRTGTYIALDYLLHQARNDTYVDIFGCAIGLRGQRVNLIQTEQQYEYLHHCVLYGITCLSEPVKEVNLKTGVNNEQISTQYDALKALESIKRGWSLTTVRKHKNQKSLEHLDERYRVCLQSSKNTGINAVYINSYLRQKQFIMSQTPLSSSIQEFISLIYQKKCLIIVCLDDDSVQNTGQYIPSDNKKIKLRQYEVTCTTSHNLDGYTVRDLKLSPLDSHQQLDIRHYQIHGWKAGDVVPSDSTSFLKLVQELNDKKFKLQEECSILIHCHTGADRSGLFCGISTMLETLTIDKQLSIIHAIYHIRERCHTAFKAFETFKFCYDCIRDLLNRDGDNKTYYNVKTVNC